MEVYDQSDHEDILSEHIIGTNENYFDEDAVSDFEAKLAKLKITLLAYSNKVIYLVKIKLLAEKGQLIYILFGLMLL